MVVLFCYVYLFIYLFIYLFLKLIENQNAVNSFLQFIYSFRETKDSPQPEYDSKEAIEALNKLMEIQNSISSSNIRNFYLFF